MNGQQRILNVRPHMRFPPHLPRAIDLYAITRSEHNIQPDSKLSQADIVAHNNIAPYNLRLFSASQLIFNVSRLFSL